MVQLLGILNVTPDSYSDGYGDPQEAFLRLQNLLGEGANIIDIGGEATNPKVVPISAEEEIRRLQPVFDLFVERLGEKIREVSFSLDSRHAKTHKTFVPKYKIAYVNDVSGLTDPHLIDVVGESQAKAFVMHSVTVPASSEHLLPDDVPAIEKLLFWAEETVERLLKAGLSSSQIILDPGIGFGKSPKQSINILENIHRLKAFGYPVLVGHSRKSFMSAFLSRSFQDRDLETAVLSVEMVRRGVDYLRIHNVEMTKRALMAHSIFQS